MSSRFRLLVPALLLTGCSLPLPQGVQVPGRVAPEQARAQDIKVLPPGPRDGASPVEVVEGFLGAQSNPDDHHAIARSFLAPRDQGSWHDQAQVDVYDPPSLSVTPSTGAAAPGNRDATVVVDATISGVIAPDGHYSAQVPAPLTETYRLRREPRGQWQLVSVPPGLRLTSADRDRSFRARSTYYIAPSYVKGSAPHLVPDQVLLPVDTDVARALVDRLLRPVSAALAGTVTSAVPAGLTASRVTTSTAGLVGVDLSAQALTLSGSDRQALSAQLVWTLRGLGAGFTGLRLTVRGRPFRVPGADEVQDNSSWQSWDPDGLAPGAPVYYVDGRRLRAQQGTLPSGPATAGRPGEGQAVAVDAVAVTPDRARLAVLSRSPAGRHNLVRTGAVTAGTFSQVTPSGRYTSPSWGSGELGLWLLRGDQELVLLPPAGRGAVQTVPLHATLPGPLTAMSVSRDGARIALVAGARLFLGRVDSGPAGVYVLGLTEVAPSLRGVSDVSWETSTSLVVLGLVQGTFLPTRLAVDGSSTQPLDGPGLPTGARPISVAASPDGVVVAVETAAGARLYRAVGRGFTPLATGSAPAYPG